MAFKEINKKYGPYKNVESSDILEVPESEVEEYKKKVDSGKVKCDHSYVIDQDLYPWYLRSCVVCGKGIGIL